MESKHTLQEVVNRFSLGLIEKEPVREKHGSVNYSYAVETSGGTFMVRTTRELHRKRMDPGRKDLEHGVTAHLRRVDFPYEVPEFLTDKKGDSLVEVDGRKWDIYRRLEGRHPKKGECSQKLIRLAAEYHKAMETFPQKDVPPRKEKFFARGKFPKDLARIVAEDTPMAMIVSENRDLYLELYNSLRNHARPGKNTIVGHRDFHSGNILCRDGRITGLIDFGNVLWTNVARDLVKFTTGEREDIERVVAEYRRHRELSEEEVNEILPEKLHWALLSTIWAYRNSGDHKVVERVEKCIGRIRELSPIWNEYVENLVV